MDMVQARYRTHDQITRNIDPYYRKFQKKMYGGREWMNIILALGTPDDTILAKMNEIVKERTEKSDPLRQRRDHMLPRAERAPRTVQGVDHHISAGKTLRMQAKALDKEIKQANEEWDRFRRSRYTWRQWQALLDQRDAAWDEAIAGSGKYIAYFSFSEVGFGIFGFFIFLGGWAGGRVDSQSCPCINAGLVFLV